MTWDKNIPLSSRIYYKYLYYINVSRHQIISHNKKKIIYFFPMVLGTTPTVIRVYYIGGNIIFNARFPLILSRIRQNISVYQDAALLRHQNELGDYLSQQNTLQRY